MDPDKISNAIGDEGLASLEKTLGKEICDMIEVSDNMCCTIGNFSGNRLNSMGFGASAMLASAIPLLNLLMLPASVVAGSLLWCRQHNDVI